MQNQESNNKHVLQARVSLSEYIKFLNQKSLIDALNSLFSMKGDIGSLSTFLRSSNNEGMNVLMLSLEMGDELSFEKLLDLADSTRNMNQVLQELDKKSRSVISYIALYNSKKALLALNKFIGRDMGAIAKLFQQQDSTGATPLMLIEDAELFHSMVNVYLNTNPTAKIESLLLDYANKNNDNLFTLAIKRNNYDLFHSLLDLLDIGNDVIIAKILSFVDNENNTLLMLACYHNDSEKITEDLFGLIDKCTDQKVLKSVIVNINSIGINLFMLSIIKKRISIYDKVLDMLERLQRVDSVACLNNLLNAKDNNGNTAFMLAISTGDLYMSKGIISLVSNKLGKQSIGALFANVNSRGQGALEIALLSNSRGILKMIMEYIKKDKNFYNNKQNTNFIKHFCGYKDSNGNTPLMQSVYDKDLEACSIFLEIEEQLDNVQQKITICRRNKKGESILAIAKDNKNILALIENFALKTGNIDYVNAQKQDVKNAKYKEILNKLRYGI